MMKSKTRALLATAFLLAGCSASTPSRSSDYLGDVVAAHENIFAARITLGRLILAGNGDPCFYQYTARVFKTFRGKEGEAEFFFFSEAHLVVGGDYLLFLSKRNATTYRSAASPVYENGRLQPNGSDCAKRMTGYFLLGNETGILKYIERNGKAVQVVEFGDPLADFPAAVTSTEVVRTVDFDYVTSRFK
jgi:hypothetical protein